MTTDTPTLSICIPAYGYEAGIVRILEKISNACDIEIIISEDPSERPLNKEVITRYENTKHIVNTRAEGPIVNWNRAISYARGKYIWLLHHDEEPIFPQSFDCLISQLRNDNDERVYLSKLRYDDGILRRALRSNLVRKLLIKSPNLVLIQNYIGAPSNIIAPRSMYPHFNVDLQYLVDVEVYAKIFSYKPDIVMSKFEIISHRYEKSITSSLRDKIQRLSLDEFEIISSKSQISLTLKILWNLKMKLRSIWKTVK